MVEKMDHSAIGKAVELHIECFRDSFLTSMDHDLLARMYENYVTSQLGRAYIYVEDGEVIGLVAGAINPSVYNSQMLREKGFHILWPLLKRVFREPKVLVSMARRNFGGFFRPDESEDAYRKASLDVICVKEERRGGEIAQKLAEAFLDELGKSGVLNVVLGVSPKNIRARRFYEKIGLKHVRTDTRPDGEQVCIYRAKLDES